MNELLQKLLNSLHELDAQPEVQALYRRGVKYITDDEHVRPHLTPELEARLKDIEAQIQNTLVDSKGYANRQAWELLRPHSIWLRHGGDDAAVLTTNSISIAFDCMP